MNGWVDTSRYATKSLTSLSRLLRPLSKHLHYLGG